MRPITTVMLDWGHTLFDTANSVDFAVQRSSTLADDAHQPLTRAEAESMLTAAIVQSRTAEELAKGRDLSIERHRECWLDLWAPLDVRVPGLAAEMWEFETGPAGWRPYPDTEPLLRSLRELSVRIVLVSDVPFDLRRFFDHYALSEFIDLFVLSSEHGVTKAQGGLFDVALAAAGCSPEQALMVGDNNANDGLAVRYGIRTYLMPHVRPGDPRGLDAVRVLVEASHR